MERNFCSACGSGDISHCFDKTAHAIWRCKECRSMFVHNVPSADELSAIYAGGEYYELEQGAVERIAHEAARRLKVLARLKSAGNYFEIGCAKGLQLDAARQAGFETFGIELSGENVRLCQEKKHHVVQGYLEDAADMVPKGGFDVISCLDVIEHVPDPAAFIKAAAEMLSRDGVMVLSTPNYSGVIAKILRDRDPYMTPPEHLNFFTLQGMRHLFQQAGLREARRASFGTLTKGERGRVMGKYFPTSIRFLEPWVVLSIPLAMKVLNILKLGMEQEFYLYRAR